MGDVFINNFSSIPSSFSDEELRKKTNDSFFKLIGKMTALEEAKDNAYKERNLCIALIAKLALACNFTAGIGQHEGENWDEDWHPSGQPVCHDGNRPWQQADHIVFIDLPEGQLSWHIHDSELLNFSFLPNYTGKWDGHSTEEKYERLQKFLDSLFIKTPF